MTEWLGSGLQNRVRRFESARGLQKIKKQITNNKKQETINKQKALFFNLLSQLLEKHKIILLIAYCPGGGMVDALDLKSSGAIRAGSTPAPGTKNSKFTE